MHIKQPFNGGKIMKKKYAILITGLFISLILAGASWGADDDDRYAAGMAASKASRGSSSASQGLLKAGDRELAFGFTWQDTQFKDDSSSLTEYAVSGSYGYFVTDALELGIKGAVSHASYDDADISAVGLGFDAKYHFAMSPNVYPYFGAQCNFLTADLDAYGFEDSASGSMYGPLFGFKTMLNQSVIFYMEYQLRLFSGDPSKVYDNVSAAVMGISCKF
jgi:hypothetical protein